MQSLLCLVRLARVAFVGTCVAVALQGLPCLGAESKELLPLGSPEFRPSPDRPLGWRGDGTGRFPAANPPTQWGRTVKGFYAELRCQAGKPAGSAQSGELLNMGFLRDWLILGPFDTKDFKTGIDEELIKDESTLQPGAGQKQGEKAWSRWHISVENQSQSAGKLLLDLAQAYGKTDQQSWQNHPGTMQPWGAYAQTSVWSPVAGKVRLRIEGNGARKAWLNGEPVKMPKQYDPSPVVELKQGWNNLVVKAVSSEGGWNFVAHVAPVPPYEYETKNIQWMTRMPGPSWCSPIVVGEKIFVNADGGTLVCVNKSDGKVLWMRSTTYYHAVAADDRKQFPELESKVKELDDLCAALPALINETISPDGMKADRDTVLNKKIKEKVELEKAIQAAMGKAEKKYRSWDNDADTSKYNVVSDGRHVWAAFWGGNKGIGANVVTCFDLEGKRVWNYFCGQTDISEHGTHCSPALCGDFLLFKSGAALFGFEKATGKVAWQKKIGTGLGATPLPVRVGKELLAYVPQAGFFRPSTGEQIWKAPFTTDITTPTINDGMIFGLGKAKETFFVFKLPEQMSDPIAVETLVKAPWKEMAYHMPGTFTDSVVGSPLYHDGLVYFVSQGGALNVVDAHTGKRVYAKPLETLNPRLTWVFVVGICSSTALGGKRLFIHDDQGQTLVLEPGREYREVAKNLLVEYNNDGMQPETQSNFFFEGERIYFRTRGFLYCLGEK